MSDMVSFDSITSNVATSNEGISPDWYKSLVGDMSLDDVTLGPKIFILKDIIEKCGEIGDKLVVFCTQLSALDLIEFVLSLMSDDATGERSWIAGKDYFRMDGSTSADDRLRYFKLFNDPLNAEARLFLVSTNAGKLGSTLIGANRMVLLDTSWNPADDNQAVYRIYRIGQSKPVYVYRFLAFGTMEEKMYARNILKESTSFRVLDDSNIERHFTHEDVRDLYTFTAYDESNRKTPGVPKDKMLAELILRHPKLIVDVHEHQQLLQNLEDDLSQEDRRIAWDEYQREKEQPAPNQTPALTPNAVAIPGLGTIAFLRNHIGACSEFWERTDITDAERMKIAPNFRNMAVRCRFLVSKAKEKSEARLADLLNHEQLAKASSGTFDAQAKKEMADHCLRFVRYDEDLASKVRMVSAVSCSVLRNISLAIGVDHF